MQKHDELIFWFDQPPKVSKGAYNYVSRVWGNKVLYIADHPFGDHRKMIKWDDDDYGAAEQIILSELDDEETYIKEVFNKYPNAVHILNGFLSDISSKIYKYITRTNVKLAVVSEKPSITHRGITLKQQIRNVFTPIKYRKIYNKYRDYVDVLMPLGAWGKELFESFGWDSEKTFSYMYCPELRDIGGDTDIKVSLPVRLLYVGRFNYATRGLDVIMKALDGLKDEEWHLDLVGGYGDKKDEIVAWAENNPKVSFLGPWPAEKVGVQMKEYDIYMVPTKFDGWNSQINEVLNAGIATITTDEAVSDEMIEVSAAGKVVRAADVKQFGDAIKMAIHNPKIVEKWKLNARNYRHKIASDSVGEYFIEILDYTFYDKPERPICPWLNREETI